MKPAIQKFRSFLETPAGVIVLFVLIFYILTFCVYWFYSPGPEERRQAQESAGAQGAAVNTTTGQAAATP